MRKHLGFSSPNPTQGSPTDAATENMCRRKTQLWTQGRSPEVQARAGIQTRLLTCSAHTPRSKQHFFQQPQTPTTAQQQHYKPPTLCLHSPCNPELTQLAARAGWTDCNPQVIPTLHSLSSFSVTHTTEYSGLTTEDMVGDLDAAFSESGEGISETGSDTNTLPMAHTVSSYTMSTARSPDLWCFCHYLQQNPVKTLAWLCFISNTRFNKLHPRVWDAEKASQKPSRSPFGLNSSTIVQQCYFTKD